MVEDLSERNTEIAHCGRLANKIIDATERPLEARLMGLLKLSKRSLAALRVLSGQLGDLHPLVQVNAPYADRDDILRRIGHTLERGVPG